MRSFARDYSGMKLRPRLTIVLVVCLIAIALPAAPAQAQGARIRLSPDDGVPGAEITVRGYNFTAESYVDFYYDDARLRIYVDGTYRSDAETDEDGDFRVTFFVPESCTGDHEVLVEDEHGRSDYADFTVKPGLTVNVEEGPVGTTITVKGRGFAENERNIELSYYLNSVDYETMAENIPASATGNWTRSFQIPPSSQGSHKIDADGDDSSFAQVKDATFRVTAGISLSTLSGSVGDSVTMTGSGFYADDRYIKILFAGEQAETEPEIIRADENGYWEASFEVPEMPTGEYIVTAEGQYTKDPTALTFEIEPGIVLSPDEGHVDMNLSVTGGGFAPNKNVVIKYDGSEVGTAGTDTEGSFSGVTFPVPQSQHGQRQVTAQDAAGNNATATFTMESKAPDQPELISPADGVRVGLIGKARPTFEWTEVEDLSGVYYSLQIAASDNITTTGEFAEPIVSIPDIVGTNYTLNATAALSYGTYYWIVQAVDRAENAGNWTAAGSFRVGLLPLWASIVIIVAIVALIGTLVYFFIIRKRIYY